MASRVSHFYEFGPFRLDASERTLRRGEEFVRLTPKEAELLLALVRGGGRVLAKEELLREVWPDTFVEEATLAQNVFTLRKALARFDAEQQYIETVPRRGYRFVPKVHERRVEEGAVGPGEGAPAGAGGEVKPVVAAGVNGGGPQAGAAPVPPAAETAGAAGPQGSAAASDSAAGSHTSVSPESAAAVSPAGAVGARPPDASPGHPARDAVLITVAVVLAAVGLVYAVYRFSLRPHLAPRPAAPFESMQLTRLPVPGAVADAAISPDGNVLAYVTNEPGGQSIWVRQISAASESRRLVEPADGAFFPGLLFSPDGQYVYYASARGNLPFGTLHRVPVFGGPARTVLERLSSPISFSPDGRRMAFIRDSVEQGRALYVSDADGGNERQLVVSTSARVLAVPAWSPDGATIACAYGLPEEFESGRASFGVTTFDAADGAERRQLPGLWFELNQLMWLPDGGGLLLSASERELSPPQIWRLPFPEGAPRRVTNDLNSYQNFSLAAGANALVTVQTDRVPNIWVAPVSDASRARQVTTGTGRFDGYYGVAWMPDGRLVYASVASGSWDLWSMNADGTGQRQLTHGARSNYGPSPSPDGRYVVFVSNRAGGPFNVWRMDADGSNPRQLTNGRGENFPHVTADGRWVVYATFGVGAAGRNRIWKVPIDGGEPVALTERPSSWPHVSPAGDSFVCVYEAEDSGRPKLAIIPLGGGPPARLLDVEPSFRMNTVWAPDGRGIAYLDARTGTPNVWLQPLPSGKPVQLTDFNDHGVTAYDFSRDGKQLVLTRTAETTGVVLIRDFR